MELDVQKLKEEYRRKEEERRALYERFGELERITLRSNCLCYGPMPKEGEEIEQLLTLSLDGTGGIIRYGFGEEDVEGKYPVITTEEILVDTKQIGILFTEMRDYFLHSYEGIYVTDVGTWELWLEDTAKEKIIIFGSLITERNSRLVKLTRTLRKCTKDKTLFGFTG